MATYDTMMGLVQVAGGEHHYLTTSEQERAHDAAVEFMARQDRRRHPSGRTDNGGRWYPSVGERRACCSQVRSPSRAWPWSYMVHCRTAEHVAHLYGVSRAAVMRAAKRIKAQEALDVVAERMSVHEDVGKTRVRNVDVA